MSIIHTRVDERLIHGQVAMVWTNVVGATRIAVVNDEAIGDEMLISALKIAKPAGIKLSILSKNKAVEKFNSNTYEGENVFVITRNIADMAYLVKNNVKLPQVNIGNVAKRDGSIMIKKSVNLTNEDIEMIEMIVQKGISVTAQMLPTESDKSIIDYIKKSN